MMTAMHEEQTDGTRRSFLKLSGAAATALIAGAARPPATSAQPQTMAPTSFVDTPTLRIGFEDNGNPSGFPIMLLHGFPDDVRAWDAVVPPLAAAGYRVLVPYLRGYGPTSFRDATAPRLAEQAAIGQDVIDFADALRLPQFAVAGYDWGGRAAAIAAALHGERVRAAVLIGGYTIQNTITSGAPGPPDAEQRLWYQWYFHTERGRLALQTNRRALCSYLWQTWSPTWRFTDGTYDRTAVSFDNPDFVDVVIHSYRHRHGNAPGDPRFIAVEEELSRRPPIQAPTITLYGADDGLGRPTSEPSPAQRVALPALVAHRVVPGAGHFLPREKPDAVTSAMLELLR
jgi:pimeloyl-ACP methyl ester carboxylesterase